MKTLVLAVFAGICGIGHGVLQERLFSLKGFRFGALATLAELSVFAVLAGLHALVAFASSDTRGLNGNVKNGGVFVDDDQLDSGNVRPDGRGNSTVQEMEIDGNLDTRWPVTAVRRRGGLRTGADQAGFELVDIYDTTPQHSATENSLHVEQRQQQQHTEETDTHTAFGQKHWTSTSSTVAVQRRNAVKRSPPSLSASPSPPWWAYAVVGLLLCGASGLGNAAMTFGVSFPAKVVCKSGKLIPMMALGRMVTGSVYSYSEYSVAFAMSAGIATFAYADHVAAMSMTALAVQPAQSTGAATAATAAAPEVFEPTDHDLPVSADAASTGKLVETSALASRKLPDSLGLPPGDDIDELVDLPATKRPIEILTSHGETFGLFLLALSVLCDSFLSNFQQKFLQQWGGNQFGMMAVTNGIGVIQFAVIVAMTPEMGDILTFLADTEVGLAYVFFLLFGQAVLGYFGTYCLLLITKQDGAVTAMFAANVRKAITIALSFLVFPKPFSLMYLIGAVLVFGSTGAHSLMKQEQARSKSGMDYTLPVWRSKDPVFDL